MYRNSHSLCFPVVVGIPDFGSVCDMPIGKQTKLTFADSGPTIDVFRNGDWLQLLQYNLVALQ